MPEVFASAPGKVILFGEHAVVHGATAIAVSTSTLRVFASASWKTEPGVTIHVPDIGAAASCAASGQTLPPTLVSAVWQCSTQQHGPASSADTGAGHSLDALFELLAAADSGESDTQVAVAPTDAMLDALQAATSRWDGLVAKALMPTLFLTAAMLRRELCAGRRGVELRVGEATLPVAAGLGSSAAFSVATATALLGLAKGVSSIAGTPISDPELEAGHRPQPGNAAHALRASASKTVNDWAFASETLFHGAPSGLDNSVSTYGGALEFRRSPARLEPVEGMPALPFMIVNTLLPKDTRALVAGVRDRLAKAPAVYRPALDAIHGVSSTFLALVHPDADPSRLEGSAPSSRPLAIASSEEDAVTGTAGETAGRGASSAPVDAAAQLHAIGKLMTTNHHLLNAIGVGHAALDTIVAAAAEHSAYAKLTGAGGGGCAVCLLSPDTDSEQLQAKLTQHGFACFSTQVAGPGALVEVGV